MQCFCGCGQTVAWRLRGTNKSGAKLRHDIRRIDTLLSRGLVSPNASLFVEQADEWCELFAMAVHTGTRPEDHQAGMRQVYLAWLSNVIPFLSDGQLGKRIRAAGLSVDEAVAQMAAGAFDPYADVVMPVPNLDSI